MISPQLGHSVSAARQPSCFTNEIPPTLETPAVCFALPGMSSCKMIFECWARNMSRSTFQRGLCFVRGQQSYRPRARLIRISQIFNNSVLFNNSWLSIMFLSLDLSQSLSPSHPPSLPLSLPLSSYLSVSIYRSLSLSLSLCLSGVRKRSTRATGDLRDRFGATWPEGPRCLLVRGLYYRNLSNYQYYFGGSLL